MHLEVNIENLKVFAQFPAGLAGLTRDGVMALGMAMAPDGTTTGVIWVIMATLASTGDQMLGFCSAK